MRFCFAEKFTSSPSIIEEFILWHFILLCHSGVLYDSCQFYTSSANLTLSPFIHTTLQWFHPVTFSVPKIYSLQFVLHSSPTLARFCLLTIPPNNLIHLLYLPFIFHSLKLYLCTILTFILISVMILKHISSFIFFAHTYLLAPKATVPTLFCITPSFCI